MISDNIIEYENLDELKESVKRDLEEFNISSSRFPIRFIFLNSHDELKNVVEILAEKATKVELSSFLQSENSWFTNSELLKKIKDIKSTSVIVPLSEYIRFANDINFYEIFSALAEIENKDIKLYVPLVGLWERFNDVFWDKYYRKDNWAPIWKLNSKAKQICIYQINGFEFKDEFETKDIKLISNTKEWFELWKIDDVSQIISLPKQLSIYFKNSLPDKTFTQEIITNPKEYLSKIFDISLNIEYIADEKEYWDNLILYVSNNNQKNISLKKIFSDMFNVNDINKLEITEFLNYYLLNKDNSFFDKGTNYKKWIIKNYLLNSKKFMDSYLVHCFRKTTKLDNIILISRIFLEIFNLDDSEKYIPERKKLLDVLKKIDVTYPERDFEENFNKILDKPLDSQLNYLTNTTYIEKEKIINILQANPNDFNSFIPKLKTIFPELYNYLDWNFNINHVPEWVLDYFKEYNKSKVLNFKSEKLKSLLNEYNDSAEHFYDWYYKLYEDFNLEMNDDNYILWIDAFGAEWLPLFTYLLNENLQLYNKRIKSRFIRSVNLPSATEFNKIKCNQKIENLDNYIHNNHYKYPKSLIEEIELLKKVAKNVSQIDSSKIIIYSDHGFSFLCNKNFGNIKRYDFEKTSHEGRYLLIEDKEMHDTEDYFVYENEYLITLNHVTLGKLPSHEVHGGATPEEVLVPCIIIENDDGVNINYEIDSLISEINISKDKSLPLKIYPEPLDMPIAIYNNDKLNVLKEDTKYIVELNSNLSKGKQKIIIKIGLQEEEIEINIKKGGMEEEEYEFGWKN